MTKFQTIAAHCDKLFNSGDPAGVEKYLLSNLAEAENCSDLQLQLFLQSELMGHYRMQGKHNEALQAVKRGSELLDQLPELDPVSAGTICINAGTALSAAGNFDRALEFCLRAEKYYAGTLNENDYLLATLQNNMASVYAAKSDFASAEICYLKALDILKINAKFADSAVTCVNLAQLYARRDPADPVINIMLESAVDCFDSPALKRDGYYAHTCLKCAPAFEFFGKNAFANELRSRAEEIYERN